MTCFYHFINISEQDRMLRQNIMVRKILIMGHVAYVTKNKEKFNHIYNGL